jgi:DNA replication protein DnaC
MQQMLTQLKLARIREIHQEWFDRAAETQMPYPDFLRGLLQEELLAREENQLRRRLKDAGFPFEKTLDDFDFRLRPELNRQVFLRYLDERFITQGRALVLVGPTGLGKTHLSVAVGLALLKRGYTVRFTTVQALLTRVLRAPGLDGRARVLKPYHASDVLILDEWGYLPADPDIGPILYEVIATRYEKKATLITSNKSLTEWGRVLHDTALAAALVDRLLHHGEVYTMVGPQTCTCAGSSRSGWTRSQPACISFRSIGADFAATRDPTLKAMTCQAIKVVCQDVTAADTEATSRSPSCGPSLIAGDPET